MRVKIFKIIWLVGLGVCFSGCEEKENVMAPFVAVENAVEYVNSYEGKVEDFRLPISNEMNDAMGMNMAIVTDRILAKGFEPNGFEQKEGYRVYRYKNLE